MEVARSRSTLPVLAAGAVLAVTLLFTTVDPWLEKAGILAGGLDALIYREGAWRILHGQSLYTDLTVGGLLYTYTPFSAIAFIPSVGVPAAWVAHTALPANLGVLYGIVLLCWRMLGYRLTPRLAVISGLLALTCTFMEPVRTTLFYGQINLVLLLLVLWDFARAEGSAMRGIGTGLSAGIKLVPGFFIVQFLALRQWRSAATALAVFVGTVALAWIVLPDDSRRYWLSTFFQSDRIADDTAPANQSIRGVLAHLTAGAAPLWLWAALSGLVALVSFRLTIRLYRCGEILLSATIAGMTACAVSPFSWGHHWVWFVPLFVHLVHRAQTRPVWWAAAGALFVSTGAWAYQWTETYASVGIFLLPKPWHSEPVLENAYMLVYAATLAYGLAIALNGSSAPGAAGSSTTPRSARPPRRRRVSAAAR
ncbi:glycosyltransferase 87 family protein [Nocardia yamanashiensis]|uniref:glycosyltransferase 87 family protein n=1 Tax=Nocardia yamanashiensis TaxID=209247 RepID=UPI001E51A7B1|nr:glycosyltransferase 87 family protein [Nocardia yamanashiensis]UGT45344.1 glycosyltransferase 87 family protein [Nocardia yamanashiensis]